MHLRVNGHVLAIGQLGPNFIILDDLLDHPPCEGEIFLSIDGRLKSWPVNLPDGLAAGKPETRTAIRLSANGSTA